MSKIGVTRKKVGPKSTRDARLESILSAAIELFAENGYEATRMDMLAEKTGLNKGTLYYYYESKADILFEICNASVSAMLESVNRARDIVSVELALQVIIDVMVGWAIDQRAIATVLYQEQAYFEAIFSLEKFHKLRKLQRQFMRLIYEILDRGMAEGVFVKMDVTIVGRSLVGVLNAPYSWPPGRASSKQVAATMTMLLLNGLRSAPAQPEIASDAIKLP